MSQIKESEEKRTGDFLGIPVCLGMIAGFGMLLYILITAESVFGVTLKIIFGFFIVLLTLFTAILLSGFIERICNSKFKINDYIYDEEKHAKTKRKIGRIVSHCTLWPSVAAFVFGVLFFNGKTDTGAMLLKTFSEYITNGWVIGILAGVIIIPLIIGSAIPSEQKKAFNIFYVIIIIIGIGASIAVYNATDKTRKVECGICHGSGVQPGYDFDCLYCDGNGYVVVESKDDASSICSSCKETADTLITKKDVGGDTVTWCSKCWDNYYDIIY